MNNKRFYTIGTIISILLIGLVVAFIVLAQKSNKKISTEEQNSESVMSSSNAVEGENSVVDKNNFVEIENGVNNTTNSNSTKENKTQKNKSENKTNNSTNTTKKTDKTKNNQTNSTDTKNKNVDPVFSYPVDGEIVMNYAKDKLAYSNTLGEWITHLGVDIKAEKTTVVKASADGTVKSIKNDPRYGLTVVIEHTNGFSTVYSNLLTAEFVKVGESVKSGQTIGTVGNTASFEILDESHLHFEILKDNEQIDPNMYLKK